MDNREFEPKIKVEKRPSTKHVCIVFFCFLSLYLIATGGGLDDGTYFESNNEIVVDSDLPSDLSISVRYGLKEDKRKTIFIPFIYCKQVSVPENIRLIFLMPENGGYQSVELIHVSEMLSSGDRDLILNEKSVDFTYHNEGGLHREPFVATTPFIVGGVDHFQENTPRVYEIQGMIKTIDDEQIEFTHTMNIGLLKKTYLTTGWPYIFDSYAPPTWLGGECFF